MERKISKNTSGINTVKITNESFDDIIGHNNGERKYFTIENNDIIYKRLKSEVSISYLPRLGPCVDFGMGDICIEENNNKFIFYVIDRECKEEYEEFDRVEDAIQKMISFYKRCDFVDNSNIMEDIFYQTLGLTKNKSKIKELTMKMKK